ncbi:NTP transferase domain-containing protein [Aquabacterium sp. NJ1]|uniref:NTP transferase domain-containing protein n=1 Tax=Aquabacterium sp. NJ1 TaxID=1538295 RepID=UPI0013770602|nr:NTP transferase domain-containing protein [Aquabacterium sp. NJ1]
MDRLPTLLVLASAPSRTEEIVSPPSALRAFSTLDSTLRMGLSSGLPILLAAPAVIGIRARQLLSGNCVIDVSDNVQNEQLQTDLFTRAVVAGVLSSANANGWILLPANTPMLRSETLKKVAHAMATQSVVYPQFRQIPGHPIGFSSEFFSELIRMQSERDFLRLIARYPAQGIDVDDPGILLGEGLPSDQRFTINQITTAQHSRLAN